jgi:hypothetical protein
LKQKNGKSKEQAKRVKAKVKIDQKNYFLYQVKYLSFINYSKEGTLYYVLTTALKDYIDQLNDLSLSLDDSFAFNVFQCSLIYIFNSMKLFYLYFIISMVNGFIELPCNFKANYSAILNGENVFQTILKKNRS